MQFALWQVSQEWEEVGDFECFGAEDLVTVCRGAKGGAKDDGAIAFELEGC